MNPTPSTPTAAPDTEEKKDDTKAAEATEEAAAADEAVDAEANADAGADDDTDADDEETAEDATARDAGDDADLPRGSAGVGVAAAAVVAAALGVVSLTGSWTGTIADERENLVGQIHTSQTATAAQQISALYGKGWHATALVNGAVGLVAAIIAVVVLILLRRTATGWARPVAVAAVVLGAIGVVVSLGMYFDLFASMPTAPPTPAAPAAPPTS